MLQYKMWSELINLKYWFLKLLGLFLIWFEPAKEGALILIFLIVVDAILDVWVKIESKQKISLKAILMKEIKDITVMLMYVLVIHYFQVAFLKETFAVFKLMLAIPVFALVSGIATSAEKLTGIPIMAKVNELLSSIFNAMSSKITVKKDEEK